MKQIIRINNKCIKRSWSSNQGFNCYWIIMWRYKPMFHLLTINYLQKNAKLLFLWNFQLMGKNTHVSNMSTFNLYSSIYIQKKILIYYWSLSVNRFCVQNLKKMPKCSLSKNFKIRLKVIVLDEGFVSNLNGIIL